MNGTVRRAGRLAAASVALLAGAGVAQAAGGSSASGRSEPSPAQVAAAVHLMKELQAESARHAAAIRAAYAPAVRRLALPDRTALRAAIGRGAILPLPPDIGARNVQPRLTGRHPIGEADLSHQHLYVAARPETVGLLLEIASRVRSGPLEITSLARHDEYQRRLGRTNANARTAVPTHVMGLAFDISILHATPDQATEIRDVLRALAAEGDLHFVAEQRQLVFHVVPAPARRSHYAAVVRRPADIPPTETRPQPFRPAAADATPVRLVHATSAPLPVIHLEAASPPAPGLEMASLSWRAPIASYAALAAWLIGSGLGTPPGEDLLLAGAGTLVSEGVLAWWPMLLLAIAAVVTSDLILFWGGRAARASATGRPRLPCYSLLQRLDAFVRRWGGAAIVVARFTPGIRALVFVSAGARGMRPVRFALLDICAAIVWVPLVMTLGAWVLASLLSAAPAAIDTAMETWV